LELEQAKEALHEGYQPYLHAKKKIDGFSGRIEFFNALVQFYNDPIQAEAKGPAFVEGVRRASKYLNGLNP